MSSIFAMQLFLGGGIFFILIKKIGKTKRYRKYLNLTLISFLLALFNAFVIGNVGFKESLCTFLFFSNIAAVLLFVKINHLISKVLFWTVTIIFTTLLFSTQSLDDILVNSRNYVSYYFILFLLPYVISCKHYKKEVSLQLVLVCVLYSFIAVGRGGIIISLLVLAGILFFKIYDKSKYRKLYITTLCIICIIVFIIGINPNTIELLFGRFIDKNMDSEARTIGWLEYLSAMIEPINFLLGVKITTLPYCYIELGESLHNSYLSLHSRMGVFAFVCLIFIFKGFIRILNDDKYVAIVLSALLIKAFVDTDFPFFYVGGDIYMYILLFNGILSKKTDGKSKSNRIVLTSISPNTRK